MESSVVSSDARVIEDHLEKDGNNAEFISTLDEARKSLIALRVFF